MSLKQKFCIFFNSPINADYEHDPYSIPRKFLGQDIQHHCGGLKKRVSSLMEVFEVCNHPHWMGPALPRCQKTFFGGLAPPCLLAGIPKKFCKQQLSSKCITQQVVFDLKNSYENVNFYFYSTSMFVKNLAIRIVQELN